MGQARLPRPPPRNRFCLLCFSYGCPIGNFRGGARGGRNEMKASITIIGGGLAGLTLGIGLRRKGVPVTILEAGHYPRHKVCGEFISGGGQQVIDRLDLRNAFISAGAIPARSVAFYSLAAKSKLRTMEPPALCLSRFKMDALLADEFRRLGGTLLEGKRPGPATSDEPLVRATGRRPQPIENGWRWFGIKAHARNIPMESDLEMHIIPTGYVGLCRLADGIVNVCGLFRSKPGGEISGVRWKSLLSATEGNPLHERFSNASFVDSSFCAVAGLSLSPKRARDSKECCIGDALTMIAPVTGNGMSMAFESAEIAMNPLTAYHRGELSWTEAREIIARACDAAFTRRLAWARLLQWMMFAPIFRGPLAAVALHSEWLWRLIFVRTR